MEKEEIKTILSNYYKKNKKKINASSLNVYVSNIYNLLKNLPDKTFVDYDLNKKYFDEISNMNTKKNYLNSAFLFMKATDVDKKIYSKYKKDFRVAAKNILEDVSNNKNHKDNIPTIDEINLAHKMTRNYSDYDSHMNFIIMEILTQVALRNELPSVMIRNFDKKKDNYYESGKLVLNKHKTSGSMGKRTIDLVSPELDKYVEKYNNDYLLSGKSNKGISLSNYNKRIKDIFKFTNKNVTSTSIRKAYVTNFYPKNMPSLKDMNKFANRMGHNINTQLLYYRKK